MAHIKEKELNKIQSPNFIYPRNPKAKRRKPDSGLLSLQIPQVQFYLSDPTRKKKCACKLLYKHAKLVKKNINTQGLTVSNCERIQVNFGAYVKLYRHLPLSQFVQNSACIYLHYFNDHSKCGH